jgi:hypothetical protein
MFVGQREMPKYEPKLMFKSPTQVLYENKIMTVMDAESGPTTWSSGRNGST